MRPTPSQQFREVFVRGGVDRGYPQFDRLVALSIAVRRIVNTGMPGLIFSSFAWSIDAASPAAALGAQRP